MNFSQASYILAQHGSDTFPTMARLPRVVVVDVPHHVTQRGNARQRADERSYLSARFFPSLITRRRMRLIRV